jgi:uncharacterized protein (TIGR02453 family)
MTAFRGWPREALDFFAGLEADNTKRYWEAHKDSYQASVRGPMDDLLADLEPEFGPSKVFRPYRDLRFSRDKSPYKTNIAAMLTRGGYIEFSYQGLSAANGMHMMAPDQIARYREAVASDRSGAQLADIVVSLRKRRIDVIASEMLSTVPRDYPKDHPRGDLLRFKGMLAWKHWAPGDWIHTSRAEERVVIFLRATSSLMEWLTKSVGGPIG